MRESCLECILKHIGQATVLMHEMVKGYKYHFVYVVGHLAEAEDEAAASYPEIKDRIYALRKSFQEGNTVDIDALAIFIYEEWRDLNDST